MDLSTFFYCNTLLGHEDGYAFDSQWKWLVSEYFDSFLPSVYIIDCLLIILEHINQQHYLEIDWTMKYSSQFMWLVKSLIFFVLLITDSWTTEILQVYWQEDYGQKWWNVSFCQYANSGNSWGCLSLTIIDFYNSVHYVKNPGAVLEAGSIVAKLELDDPSKVTQVQAWLRCDIN